jgi:ankyrin repeat protein
MPTLQALIEASARGDLQQARSILQSHPELIDQKDAAGATALHYAAFNGHRAMVEFLVQQGANINATDTQFNATPAGWAIEYMREMGAFLSIELADFAHAIRTDNFEWTARFLERFPALRHAHDTHGTAFGELAAHSENPRIVRLFESGRAH